MDPRENRPYSSGSAPSRYPGNSSRTLPHFISHLPPKVPPHGGPPASNLHDHCFQPHVCVHVHVSRERPHDFPRNLISQSQRHDPPAKVPEFRAGTAFHEAFWTSPCRRKPPKLR